MPSCAMKGCSNRNGNGNKYISYHRFPTHEERRNKWIQAVGRNNWDPGNHSAVCSDHFLYVHFNRRNVERVHLKKNAVPTNYSKTELAIDRMNSMTPLRQSMSKVMPLCNGAIGKATNIIMKRKNVPEVTPSCDALVGVTTNLTVDQKEVPEVKPSCDVIIGDTTNLTVDQKEVPEVKPSCDVVVGDTTNLTVDQKEVPEVKPSCDVVVGDTTNLTVNQKEVPEVKPSCDVVVGDTTNPTVNRKKVPKVTPSRDTVLGDTTNLILNRKKVPKVTRWCDVVGDTTNITLNRKKEPKMTPSCDAVVGDTTNPTVNRKKVPKVTPSCDTVLGDTTNLTVNVKKEPTETSSCDAVLGDTTNLTVNVKTEPKVTPSCDTVLGDIKTRKTPNFYVNKMNVASSSATHNPLEDATLQGLPPDLCQCCLSSKDLRSIVKPYLYHGKNEVYSEMLTTCFSSELSADDGLICSDCVRRLRSVVSFRQCIEYAKSYFNSQITLPKPEINTTTQLVVPSSTTREVKKKSISEIKRNERKERRKAKNSKYMEDETHSLKAISETEDFEDSAFVATEDTKPELLDPEPTESNTVSFPHSESSSEEDDFFSDCFNPINPEVSLTVLSRTEFDVGEQRNLPYILDNTDRTCEICHKEFSFFGELLKHMPEHYPNHICDICGKICATRKSLVFHAKTHTDVRLDCQMCDKSFKNKSNLNAHVKVQHKGEKIFFKCVLCGELLNTYNARIKHLAEKHGREDKAYKCLQCPCKYRLGSHLRAHVRRVHLQEKNHKCQECGLSFFTRKVLENHLLKHSGERNFTCRICSKSYGRKESLRQHVKSHEAEKQNYLINAEPMQHFPQEIPIEYAQHDERYAMRNFMRM